MTDLPSGFNRLLKNLADDIFACFLNPDYTDNLYLYEHRIHQSKKKCIAFILQQNAPTPSRLIAIYNTLIDCGLLRWRIQDKTVFAVCREEMKAIIEAFETGILTPQLAAMESIYQNVLMVTAKEPLPFYLFIQSLKMLEVNLIENHSAST